ARVVITGRDLRRSQATVDEIQRRAGRKDVESLLCDFASLASIRALAASVRERFGTLSILINNAGAVNTSRELSRDGLELTFAVNHLGYFLLACELVDVLKANAPARIVNVASNAHKRGSIHFDDLELKRGYSPWAAYSQSKLANVMFTYELARRLAGTGVTVNCVHPGVVATNFGGQGGLLALGWKLARPFLLTSAQGAKTSIWAAVAPELAN